MIQGLGKRLERLVSTKDLQRRHVIFGFLAVLILLISAIHLSHLSPYQPATNQVQYFRAKVISVSDSKSVSLGKNQTAEVEILDGPDSGRDVTVSRSLNYGDASYQRLPVGSEVLLTKESSSGNQYTYLDRWHIPGMITLFLILLALIIIIGWWRGITSVVGLVISIGVIADYVIPRIVAGYSPYATCIQAAFIITIISIYVAHGFSKRTSIAFLSSLLTLLLVIGLVALATYLVGTSEVVSDDNVGVLYGPSTIGLSSLLTGGIVIGSLGVLYDITTGQAAAVDEIHKANGKLSALELYRKGLSVGREHIAALVNTLVLVYVGIALPSILMIVLYAGHIPLIVALNGEAIAEEVVRTAVASIGMLLAVPIATGLAAYALPRWYNASYEKKFETIKDLLSGKYRNPNH
jgi:uncharacterized membrane protein